MLLYSLTLFLNTGLSFGAFRVLQVGARLRGSLLGSSSVGGACLCILVGKKFSDYYKVWRKVKEKRRKYKELSEELGNLKETVEKELQKGVQLVDIPDLE